jgi:hypothetical protein
MSELNPYAAPQFGGPLPHSAEANGGVWRDGIVLVMHKQAVLPDRCVKCNESVNGLRLKRKLSWHHPALYLMIFFPGLLFYAIVALIVRKTARIDVGICERHRSRRRIGIAVAWLIALLGFAMFFFTTQRRSWPPMLHSTTRKWGPSSQVFSHIAQA